MRTPPPSRGKGPHMTADEVFAVHAPEFTEGLDWIGTAAPLTMAGLRGAPVLLDFWTAG